jgi:hypothetical protein
MSAFAFVNYSRFLTSAGAATAYAYQNFTINQSRIYGGVTYQFAPFAYTLGAGSKGGDRSDSSLIAGLDPISVNLFAEAAENRYLLEVKTVSLDPETFADDVLVRTELWRVAQYEMDWHQDLPQPGGALYPTQKVVLRLSSPLDATKGDIPKRRLSTKLVGALPSTGSLVIS